MRFVEFHHIQVGIPAGTEPAARRFYGEVLGLVEIAKPPHLAARGGLWFGVGADELHLGVESTHRPADRAHPAFRVEGLDELIRRLAEHGIETEEDLPLPGFRRVYARDPFGNRLEFLESESAGTH